MKKILVVFCSFVSGIAAMAIEPEKDASGNLTFTVASGAESYSGIIEGNGISVTKKGAGSLTLTGANTFTGQLIVEEGTLIASTTAHEGQPDLIVKNGATFVSDGGGETWVKFPMSSIAIEGSGVDGQGAFVRKSGTSVRTSSAPPMSLTGDATVNFKIAHNPGAVSLNGYTLTKIGAKNWDACGSGVVSAKTDSADSFGKIIIAEGALQIQNAAFSNGSDKNVLVLKSGTALNMYSLNKKCPWSIKVEGDVTFTAKDESENKTVCLGGDVEISGGVLKFDHSKANSIWRFDGSVKATDGASLSFVDGITRFYGDVDLGPGTYTVSASDSKLPDARVEFLGNFTSSATAEQSFWPKKGVTRFRGSKEVSIASPIGDRWDKYDISTTGRVEVVDVNWFYHPNVTYLSGTYEIPQTLYITNSVWRGASKIIVGNNYSVGRVEMYDSIVTNSMTVGGLYTGKSGYVGGVLQYGGSVDMPKGAAVHIGGAKNRSHGYYEKHGGELSVGDSLYLGYFGYGVMNLHGGASTFAKITMSGKYDVASASSGSSVFYSNGGAYTYITELAFFKDATATNCESLMVLEGEGTKLRADTCTHYAASAVPSVAILAVNDGAEFNAGRTKRDASNHDKSQWLYSVDGGTLACSWYGEYWGTGDFLQDSVIVHSGGLKLNTVAEGGTFEWKMPLVSPTGKIVSSIALPSDESFEAEQGLYIAPPRVKISGSGTGAAAVALYDWKTRRVTGIKVVAPGSGYDENTKAYILNKSNGAVNPFECPVTLVDAPTTGNGFTKIGPGTYSFDVANTYHGPTTVAEGKLVVNNADGIPSGSSLRVESGATLDLKSHDITVPSLSGEGTVIAGGSLSVADSLTLPVKTAGKIVVDGQLTLGEGAKVVLDGDVETLDREVGTVLLSATSLVADKSLVLPALPEPWHISVGEKGITIRRMVGTVVILR